MFPAASFAKPNQQNIVISTGIDPDTLHPPKKSAPTPGPEYRPDPSVKLWRKRDATFIETNPSVQALLQLDSPLVELGGQHPRIFAATTSSTSSTSTTRTPKTTPGTFDPNIPERDRTYARMANEGMLRLFMDRVLTYDRNQQDWSQPLPYDRIKSQFLTVLSYYPERQNDIEILRFATRQMENYLTAYREILADAVSRRPDLMGPLEHVGVQTMEDAVMLALEQKPVYGVLLTAEEMLEKATAWAASQTLQRQLKESSDFYSSADGITGVGGARGSKELHQLANGNIFYPDLPTLLRHAPMGVVHFNRLMGSSFLSGGIRVGIPPKTEIVVTYGPGTVQQLHYWKDRAHQQYATVVVGADGYWEDDGLMETFSEKIPDEVRKENLKRIEQLVIAARNRRG